MSSRRLDPGELATFKANFANREWRLRNLYRIVDKNGDDVQFEPNATQVEYLAQLHTRNLCLKSRQHGITTVAAILALDTALFRSNTTCGLVMHKRTDAEKVFQGKILYAYDRTPEIVRRLVPMVRRDLTGEAEFANGSKVQVSLSHRSGTLQFLHVCLAGDTEIVLKDGLIRPIRDIEAGALVLTSKGSYRPVRALVKTPLAEIGDKMVAVTSFGHYAPLRLTENHRVMVREHRTGGMQWKRAGELATGDYLAYPVREPSQKLRDGCLPMGTGRVPANFDLGWIAGLYLAEGTARRSEVAFAVHRKEVGRTLAALDMLAGCYASKRVYDHAHSLTSVVTVNGTAFSNFLGRFFGSGPDKRIPDAVFNYGRQFLDGLLKGYLDGDGCYRNTRLISVTSIRRQLLQQVKMLLIALRFGYPAIYHADAGLLYGRHCKEAWTLKLGGAGNWKFRAYFNLPPPPMPASRSGKWRIAHGRNPEGRKHWRRGADVYWARIKKIEAAPDEEYVYDLALDEVPHDYVTASGVVHNSEYGPMCAMFPQRAREVKTGALNTVSPDAIVTIESTAHGRIGDFYKMAHRAREMDAMVKAGTAKLSKLDYRFMFFPWFDDPVNTLDPEGVPITDEDAAYFQKLEDEHGIKVDAGQRAWYVKKAQEQNDKMKQEHPSTPDEAFEQAIEGAYYGKEMAKAAADGRICDLPIIPGIPVNLFFDIGMSDSTSIWFHQQVGVWHHFIDYYENSGEQVAHYIKKLREKDYLYGKLYLPHDGVNTEWGGQDNLTRLKIVQKQFPGKVVLVPRIDNLQDGIDMTRQVLPRCRFDRRRCGESPAGSGHGGIPALQSYRHAFNELLSVWHDYPLHDWASNGADAFRQFAQGYPINGINDETAQAARHARRGDRNWRTA